MPSLPDWVAHIACAVVTDKLKAVHKKWLKDNEVQEEERSGSDDDEEEEVADEEGSGKDDQSADEDEAGEDDEEVATAEDESLGLPSGAAVA